jgi:hypothetical protein
MTHVAEQIAIIASVGVLTNAIEIVHSRRGILKVLDWRIVSTDHVFASWPKAALRVFGPILGNRGLLVMVVLQAAAASAILSGVFPKALPWLCGFVAAAQWLYFVRSRAIVEGADCAVSIIWTALVLFHIAPTSLAREAVLWFIALQFAVAYVSAACWKLGSPEWRAGKAVGLAVATQAFGSPWFARLVSRFGLSPLLTWATIAVELLGPFAMLISPEATLVFLILILGFHVGVAVTMGLPLFVWSFGASYPAMYFVSERLAGRL